MLRIALLTFMVYFSLACAHLPKDIHPNPAKSGHHRMEFDTFGIDKKEKKELGISNFYLYEDQDLSDLFFRFNGIRYGTLYMKSNACGIDATMSFSRTKTFYLAKLIPKPTKCSIRLTAETAKIKKRQHNIVETGVVKLNVIPKKSKPVRIEYYRTNDTQFKKYSYVGQGSMQRQEGDLTSQEHFTVLTETDGGGVYRITGCGEANVFSDNYEGKQFKVTLSNIYNKRYLNRDDSCDFEIIVIPNEELYKYLGRFSINIYGKDAIKLEPLKFDIYKSWGRWKIKAWGRDYVLGCSINSYQWIKKRCKMKYYKDKTYWIRFFTSNGRKSLYCVMNNEIIWRE